MSEPRRARLPLLGVVVAAISIAAAIAAVRASRDEWALHPAAEHETPTRAAPAPEDGRDRDSHSPPSADIDARPAPARPQGKSAPDGRVVIDPADAMNGPTDALTPPEVRVDATIVRGEDPGDAPLIPPTVEVSAEVAPRGTAPPSDAPLTPPVLVIDLPGSAP